MNAIDAIKAKYEKMSTGEKILATAATVAVLGAGAVGLALLTRGKGLKAAEQGLSKFFTSPTTAKVGLGTVAGIAALLTAGSLSSCSENDTLNQYNDLTATANAKAIAKIDYKGNTYNIYNNITNNIDQSTHNDYDYYITNNTTNVTNNITNNNQYNNYMNTYNTYNNKFVNNQYINNYTNIYNIDKRTTNNFQFTVYNIDNTDNSDHSVNNYYTLNYNVNNIYNDYSTTLNTSNVFNNTYIDNSSHFDIDVTNNTNNYTFNTVNIVKPCNPPKPHKPEPKPEPQNNNYLYITQPRPDDVITAKNHILNDMLGKTVIKEDGTEYPQEISFDAPYLYAGFKFDVNKEESTNEMLVYDGQAEIKYGNNIIVTSKKMEQCEKDANGKPTGNLITTYFNGEAAAVQPDGTTMNSFQTITRKGDDGVYREYVKGLADDGSNQELLWRSYEKSDKPGQIFFTEYNLATGVPINYRDYSNVAVTPKEFKGNSDPQFDWEKSRKASEQEVYNYLQDYSFYSDYSLDDLTGFANGFSGSEKQALIDRITELQNTQWDPTAENPNTHQNTGWWKPQSFNTNS